jgi:hypothetical protein
MVTGVTDPSNSPGAMRDREVVRVVYVDQAERLLTLDQQRWPAGRGADRDEPQISSSGSRHNAQWVVGGVWLSLTAANMPEDEFRAMVRRVR